MITNGQMSYSVFTYKFGLMGWSGGATIGYNTDGNFYWNHFLSGTDNTNDVAKLHSSGQEWSNIVSPLCKYASVIQSTTMLTSTKSLSDMDHLSFLTLGNTSDVEIYSVPSGINTISPVILVETGFPFGEDNDTKVYVRNELCL